MIVKCSNEDCKNSACDHFEPHQKNARCSVPCTGYSCEKVKEKFDIFEVKPNETSIEYFKDGFHHCLEVVEQYKNDMNCDENTKLKFQFLINYLEYRFETL